jgi:hypothetical protein
MKREDILREEQMATNSKNQRLILKQLSNKEDLKAKVVLLSLVNHFSQLLWLTEKSLVSPTGETDPEDIKSVQRLLRGEITKLDSTKIIDTLL